MRNAQLRALLETGRERAERAGEIPPSQPVLLKTAREATPASPRDPALTPASD